jgi:hypothetical protein
MTALSGTGEQDGQDKKVKGFAPWGWGCGEATIILILSSC